MVYFSLYIAGASYIQVSLMGSVDNLEILLPLQVVATDTNLVGIVVSYIFV